MDTTVLVSWLLNPNRLIGKIIKSLELELSTPYRGVNELWEHRGDRARRRSTLPSRV